MLQTVNLITCSLLVILASHFVLGSEDGAVQYTMRINEKGTRFDEKIRIDEKRNTVSFIVPKHNDVENSEVLNEFNLNLTITRMPDVGICTIKPLDKNLPSPRKMKSDMNYMSHMRGRFEKVGTLVRSSEWVIDKKLDAKDLHPTVIKFCAGFPVYRMKDITEDNKEMEVFENDNANGNKRESGYPMCDPNKPKLACAPPTWLYYCKLRTKSCVYWAKCNLRAITTAGLNPFSLKKCQFSHEYNSVVCCEFRCPTK